MGIRDELAKTEFYNRENTLSHIPYDKEMSFYQSIRNGDMEEMQEINDELSKLPGQKLMIARKNMLVSEIMITFYDIKDTDVYLAEEDYDVSDETIILKASNASKEVNVADYDYIVYEINLWEESNEGNISAENVILQTEDFIVVEN